MRVRLFTLRYSATLGGFDETPIGEWTRDKEVLEFREHFFSAAGAPHLVCVVLTQDALVPGAPTTPPRNGPDSAESGRAPQPRGRRKRPDAAADLDEAGRALFNTLREWRAETAREAGIPAYLVFTNRQLAEIIRRRPESPTALGHIAGIGPARIKRYGKQVLSLLGRAPAAKATA